MQKLSTGSSALALALLATSLIAIAPFRASATSASDPNVAKTVGYTQDGNGTQIVVYPAAGLRVDNSTLASLNSEAHAAFASQHPEQATGSTVTWFQTGADGEVTVTVMPYNAGGSGGTTTQTAGVPPETPPAPGPSTPSSVDHVDYQQHNINGWNRDTLYQRTVTALPNNGGFIDGDWQQAYDHLDLAPPGSYACGTSGYPTCPKQN